MNHFKKNVNDSDFREYAAKFADEATNELSSNDYKIKVFWLSWLECANFEIHLFSSDRLNFRALLIDSIFDSEMIFEELKAFVEQEVAFEIFRKQLEVDKMKEFFKTTFGKNLIF